jgi:hypothetical protein
MNSFPRLMLPLLLAVTSGCQRGADIRVYNVPVAERPQPDRLFGGILLRGEQAWYFKVTGPRTSLDAEEATIRTFLASVTFAADTQQPSWKLPANWREDTKQRPGRLTTLLIPASGGEKPLELSVSSLPLPPGDERGYLLANVNRWCDQMGAPHLADEDLDDLDTIAAGEEKLRFVSLTGTMSAGGMTPPFAS